MNPLKKSPHNDHLSTQQSNRQRISSQSRSQLKTGALQAKTNHPTPPPVYRPQPIPKVLQTKLAGGQHGGGATVRAPATPASRPVSKPHAPPVYRPQPMPKVLQTKMAAGHPPFNNSGNPAAPPVYRPQPNVPTVNKAGAIKAVPGKPGRQVQPALRTPKPVSAQPNHKSPAGVPPRGMVKASPPPVGQSKAVAQPRPVPARGEPVSGLIQRKIIFKPGDTLGSLLNAHPALHGEINEWEQSPYNARYTVNGTNNLKWSLGGGSFMDVMRVGANVFRRDAESLSTSSPVASEVWQCIKVACPQYPEEARDLFRAFLTLYQGSDALTHILVNTFGNVRLMLLKILTQQLQTIMGRPVIEGEIKKSLPDNPELLSVWGKNGWESFNDKWKTLKTDEAKREFVCNVFDHNKGYNRANNFISDFVASPTIRGSLATWLKRQKLPQSLPPDGSKEYIELWGNIIGEVMLATKFNSPTLTAWQSFMRNNMADLETGLAGAKINRQAITVFINQHLKTVLLNSFLIDEEDEFVVMRPPPVKPFPKPPGW